MVGSVSPPRSPSTGSHVPFVTKTPPAADHCARRGVEKGSGGRTAAKWPRSQGTGARDRPVEAAGSERQRREAAMKITGCALDGHRGGCLAAPAMKVGRRPLPRAGCRLHVIRGPHAPSLPGMGASVAGRLPPKHHRRSCYASGEETLSGGCRQGGSHTSTIHEALELVKAPTLV